MHTVDVVEFDENGEDTTVKPVSIWATPKEEDGGIWITLAEQDDGGGTGIHINDALLAQLGFTKR